MVVSAGTCVNSAELELNHGIDWFCQEIFERQTDTEGDKRRGNDNWSKFLSHFSKTLTTAEGIWKFNQTISMSVIFYVKVCTQKYFSWLLLTLWSVRNARYKVKSNHSSFFLSSSWKPRVSLLSTLTRKISLFVARCSHVEKRGKIKVTLRPEKCSGIRIKTP